MGIKSLREVLIGHESIQKPQADQGPAYLAALKRLENIGIDDLPLEARIRLLGDSNCPAGGDKTYDYEHDQYFRRNRIQE